MTPKRKRGFIMKNFIQKYKHAWVFLYGLIYLPWFFYLEQHVTTEFNLIHSPLDDKIPFIEFFVVPYLLWFGYIAVTVGYFFFHDKREFYQLVSFLFTGMTIFLIISTVYPNGLDLRPAVFPRDNIFTDMVKTLYITDTSTNVLPSIHVFNSIGAYIAIHRSQALRKHKSLQIGTFFLTVSIILSTMFLKQHSVIDVVSAFLMAAVLYFFVYAPRPIKSETYAKQTIG